MKSLQTYVPLEFDMKLIPWPWNKKTDNHKNLYRPDLMGWPLSITLKKNPHKQTKK